MQNIDSGLRNELLRFLKDRIVNGGSSGSDVNIATINGSTPNLAEESGGNLDTISTNTTNMYTAIGDLALETGGNLETLKDTLIDVLASVNNVALENGGNLDTLVNTTATLALENGGNLDTINTLSTTISNTLDNLYAYIQILDTIVSSLATIERSVSQMAGYSIAQKDTSDLTYNYFGFIKENVGSWYIMRENKTTGEFLYTVSSNIVDFDGVSGWSDRANKTYTRQSGLAF